MDFQVLLCMSMFKRTGLASGVDGSRLEVTASVHRLGMALGMELTL